MDRRDEVLKSRCLAEGIAIGMGLCAPLGIVLSMVTETPGLLGIGPAIGAAMGLAIGEARYQNRMGRNL